MTATIHGSQKNTGSVQGQRAQPVAAQATKRAAPQARGPTGPKADIKWVQVSEDCPLVLEQGLSELAPCLRHEEGIKELLSQSKNILWDITGDNTTDVEITHDSEWTDFPDIHEAILRAGGQKDPIAVATCPSQNKWAVGIAGQWKKREQAARLALCLALAANIDDFAALAKTRPEFTIFCENSGISTDTDLASLANPEPPSKKQKVTQQSKAPTPPPAPVAKVEKVADASKLPRETPMWICVEEALPEVLESLTPEAIAVCTDSDKCRGLGAAADRAIEIVLPGGAAGIQYHDDFNWEVFSAVGNAVKAIAPTEECLCVTTCPEKEIWAVGFGMKSKSRYAAAKVAIATALVIQAEEEGVEVDRAEIGVLGDFVEDARAARDSQ